MLLVLHSVQSLVLTSALCDRERSGTKEAAAAAVAQSLWFYALCCYFQKWLQVLKLRVSSASLCFCLASLLTLCHRVMCAWAKQRSVSKILYTRKWAGLFTFFRVSQRDCLSCWTMMTGWFINHFREGEGLTGQSCQSSIGLLLVVGFWKH